MKRKRTTVAVSTKSHTQILTALKKINRDIASLKLQLKRKKYI